LRIKKKLVLLAFALIVVASLVAYFQSSPKSPPMKGIGVSIPSLTNDDIRNPEIALEYGFTGYVEATLGPNAPKSMTIRKGEEASITVLLHFVSHDPEVKEVQVTLNPEGEGLKIEQSYVIVDEKGNVVSRGVININEFVRYNPSGTVTIHADENLPVTLTIRVPIDFPGSVSPFQLGLVGVSVKASKGYIPVLCDARVMVYA